MTQPTALDCAREPIRWTGATQPHGYLVSCRLSDWTVRHASTNINALLDVDAGELVGETLRDHLPEEFLRAIADTVGYQEPGAPAQRVGATNIGPAGTLCDVCVHLAEGLVHVEIEPLAAAEAATGSASAIAQAVIARLGSDEAAFQQDIAEQVRQLSGYDRVMVYRFHEDDSGEVVAESVADGMEPYLGLRYPASDIPAQARQLYLRNRIRVIPDAGYEPVAIHPPVHADGAPLDLAQHALRSVSPVHLEYLRNMGVAASMSISIINGGRLWGLVACHHRTPRLVPPLTRATLDLLGMYLSMRVAADEQERTMQDFERAEQVRETLRQALPRATDFDAALGDHLELLREALDCDGAALWLGSRWQSVGATPDPRLAAELLEWLAQRTGDAQVVATDQARDWRSPLLDEDEIAGVMALCLGGREDWLLLFRREQLREVRWAGEPAKALVPTDDGVRIAPRRSFATWREQVRGRSKPWTNADLRAGERLHRLLHEARRLALARAEDVDELEGLEQRRRLYAQRQRLSDLSQLLDGLVHLDREQTRSLETRIRELEDELRTLIRRPRETPVSA